AQLAELVASQAEASGPAAKAAIARAPRGGDLPPSFAQERLWFLQQLDPRDPSYNVPTALRVSGAFAPLAFERTIGALVHRHESLRTRFVGVDGRPVQRIEPEARVAIPLVDLGALPASRQETEIARLAGENARRPFDLARAPLVRVHVLRAGPAEHVLCIDLH